MPVIDGDSHFMEPLDLFERYIDPQFLDKAMRVAKDPTTSKSTLVVEGRQLHILNVEELLAAVVGYGQKEGGHDLRDFDRALTYSNDWQDMGKLVQFLDRNCTGGVLDFKSLNLHEFNCSQFLYLGEVMAFLTHLSSERTLERSTTLTNSSS